MTDETKSGTPAPPNAGSVVVHHLCEHCNQEYKLTLGVIYIDGATHAVHNFGNCPLCFRRNDLWIRVGITPNTNMTGGDAAGGETK